MEKEARFQEMLKDLCMLARVNKNTVTKQLVEEFFQELALKKEQLELIFAYLKEQKIHVLPDGALRQEENRSDRREKYFLLEQGLGEAEEGEADRETKADERKKAIDSAVFDEQVERLCLDLVGGDSLKKQELLEIYQPKIREYVKGFSESGLLEEDLLQEAGLGLLLALESLTVKSEDICFAEYLEAGIENEIRNALEEEFQAKKADETLEKKINQLHNKLVELGEELERRPTIEEVCMYMKLSKEEADYYFRLMGDGNSGE